MSKHLVFVYGTLRSGGAGAMSDSFPSSRFVGPANVKGSLYDLGAYPGVLIDGSSSIVIGEVYEVDDELLSQLDEFEAGSDYRRKQVEVLFAGQPGSCWVYEPDPECYSLRTVIPSGDWLEYSRQKTDWPEDAT